jgi:hypothetical protein
LIRWTTSRRAEKQKEERRKEKEERAKEKEAKRADFEAAMGPGRQLLEEGHLAKDAVVAAALMESLEQPAAEKAKEAVIFYVQSLHRHRQVHRRKRQWKRQQEELRVLQ